VWGLWHGPLFLGAVRTSAGLPDALDLFIRLFTFLPAFRVLMVWMYDRTGSLPLAMIMHMFLTASTLILQPAATGIQVAIYDLVFAALLWAAVAVAAIGGGGRLTAERGMTAQVS
jgi:membrane protease YdiL (CAAX protease family)